MSIFTGICNLAGIGINIAVIIIFMSLSFGIQKEVINKLKGDRDYFVIEVQSDHRNHNIKKDDLTLILKKYINDIVGIYPTISSYSDFKLKDSSEINSSNIVYTKNYSHYYDFKDSNEKKIMDLPAFEIIIPEQILKKEKKDEIIGKECEIIATNKITRENKSFPCKIFKVVKNTFFTNQVLLSNKFAKIIHYWMNNQKENEITDDFIYYQYEVLVKDDLTLLESIQIDINKIGLSTRSLLERVHNIKKVISLINIVFMVFISFSIIMSMFNVSITFISSILRRQEEIGILKALGAKNKDINKIYIIQGLYIILIGNLFGNSIAFILLEVFKIIGENFENIKDLKIYELDAIVSLYILFISILISMIFSILPIKKISSIEIIDILRKN